MRDSVLEVGTSVTTRPAAGALDMQSVLQAAREAQSRWARQSMRQRLNIIRRLRHCIARDAEALAASVPASVPGSVHRNLADTLASEVLPLADACRFLEQNGASILAPRKLSRRSRPFFLRHVEAVVERVPFGVVLVIGPANYPLFLPGVQTLQALVAGNAVLWKPSPVGAKAAIALIDLLHEAGLPSHLVTMLDTDLETAQAAMRAGIDKVVLTGHIATGRAVLRALAETATPAVMELSGCDAVFILPGADLHHAANAITFGLRLNGSAICMAPRRIFVAAAEAIAFERILLERLREAPSVPLTASLARALESLIDNAKHAGARATLFSDDADNFRPVLISDATPEMRCMQTDIFAPIVSMMEFSSPTAAVAAHQACPYSLTASVFGPEDEAHTLAGQLRVGTVLINDVVVCTADPRLPFGGRDQSGFGVTRGAEGLLEMTAIRTVATQKRADTRAYEATTEAHVPFFGAYVRAIHSSTWPERFSAWRALGIAARAIPKRTRTHSKQS